MKLYYPFSSKNNTPISINKYKGLEPIKPHVHDFHEMVLITKGTCRFFYENTEHLLIAGDLYLIKPHELHTYYLDGAFECYNLMYRTEMLQTQNSRLDYNLELKEMHTNATRKLTVVNDENIKNNNINRCSILHLNSIEANKIENLMENILQEQNENNLDYETAQLSFFNLLIINIKRIQKNKFSDTTNENLKNYLWIDEVLNNIEMKLCEDIDFVKIADELHISLSHFRRVFKSTVGLSPVNYLNRLRVITSLIYLQNPELTISDVATLVGIDDANYYSRIFKKNMGYSPKYFKNLKEN